LQNADVDIKILHQILVYWSYTLERTPKTEVLVSQLFPFSLVCVIDKWFLYGKCHCSTTRRQLMTKHFPFSNHFSSCTTRRSFKQAWPLVSQC